MDDFTYIDDQDKLTDAIEIWKKESILGIDLECENNMHHYGCFLSLIQVSAGKKQWIVDALSIKDLSGIVAIFEDPGIEKIFHGPDFDFRILAHALDCHPKNIFDTQIAAQLIGENEIGLGVLLEKYFCVEKKMQISESRLVKKTHKEGYAQLCCKRHKIPNRVKGYPEKKA